MLSRASSDAGTRLRRSKSTSTVHSHRAAVPEPLDPDVAQKHALAAATTAFVRAQANSAPEWTKSRSSELSRTQSNASRKSQGSHFHQREPSLRSLRPKTSGKTFGVPRQTYVSTMPTEKFPPFYVSPGTDNTMSTQPSISSNENMRPSSQPKAQRPSAASSMASQQIRKARSMYYASSVQTGSPLPRPPSKYLTTPPPISPAPGGSTVSAHSAESSLLSHRSATGYSQRPRNSVLSPLSRSRPPVTVAPNEAIDKARDKCLQDFQQQRHVKHKPSLFLAPFKKRQDNAKRKGPMYSSSDVSGSGIVSVDASLDTTLVEIKPLKEKRSISDSLRNKFKKVFRRGSNKVDGAPAQHIEATRDYYRGVGDSPSGIHDSGLGVPSPDESTLHRVMSRSPTLEGGRPAFARPSSRGSNRSLHSEVTLSNAGTSRVTSWGSSSIGDTLTQRAIKRLTVIHEAKDSIGSVAESQHAMKISPKRKPPPIPGFAAFREPMPVDGLMEDGSTPVDPKRVFSALMREIDTANSAQQKHAEVAQEAPDDDNDVFVSHASRNVHSSGSMGTVKKEFRASASSEAISQPSSKILGNSVKSSSLQSFGRALKSTIRTVTPSDHRPHSSPVLDRTTTVRGAVRTPRFISIGSSESAMSEKACSQGVDSLRLKTTKESTSVSMQTNSVVTPTREQIERRVQKSYGRGKTPLEERTLSSLSHTTRYSNSAVEEASALPPAVWPKDGRKNTMTKDAADQLCVHDSHQYTDPAHPSSPKTNTFFSPLSPSVYSRNTDGASILPNESIMSLDEGVMKGSDSVSVSGSAVIITSHSVKSYVIGTPTPQKESASTRSSRDWKAWLSHEVSELGSLPNEEIAIHNQYGISTAHRREFTQISEGNDSSSLQKPEESPILAKADAANMSTAYAPSAKPTVSRVGSCESGDLPTESVVSLGKASPLSRSSPLLKTRRLSSNPSERSSVSRPSFRHWTSDRMNERFPFIDTGRRSSSHSGRYSRHTPSLPGSRSSSSKATPSPKVYSDFSAPSSNRVSKPDVTLRGSKSAVLDEYKENRKENVTPSSKAERSVLAPQKINPLDRPKSMQPLGNPSWNRTTSVLAQYTTSADNMRPRPSPTGDRAVIHARRRPHLMSPGKLTARPKSAFDLRNANSSPNAVKCLYRGATDSPKNREAYRSRPSLPLKQFSSRGTEGEGLQSILESPQVARQATLSRASKYASASDLKRPILHLKQSSSTLELNKEPSPTTEYFGIDALLDNGITEAGRDSRGGSVTPGQRMAEKFIRERAVETGAGSPALAFAEDRSTTASPVFI